MAEEKKLKRELLSCQLDQFLRVELTVQDFMNYLDCDILFYLDISKEEALLKYETSNLTTRVIKINPDLQYSIETVELDFDKLHEVKNGNLEFNDLLDLVDKLIDLVEGSSANYLDNVNKENLIKAVAWEKIYKSLFSRWDFGSNSFLDDISCELI